MDLEGIVKQIAGTLRDYRVATIAGDRYSAGWVRQAFEREGIRYEEARDKAGAYLELEPLFAQGRIEILDHPQLVKELKFLERRSRPGGRDAVDHPRGCHDDYANSLAVAGALAQNRKSEMTAESIQEMARWHRELTQIPPWRIE